MTFKPLTASMKSKGNHTTREKTAASRRMRTTHEKTAASRRRRTSGR